MDLLEQKSLPALNQPRQVDSRVVFLILCQNEAQGRGLRNRAEGPQKVAGLNKLKFIKTKKACIVLKFLDTGTFKKNKVSRPDHVLKL